MKPADIQKFIQEQPIPQVQKVNNSCIQLCDNGLCSLQKSHGHSYLPDVCASYPRFLGRNKSGTEVGGFLSCPEVVRLSMKFSGTLEECSVHERVIEDIDIQNADTVYVANFLQVRQWFEKRKQESTTCKEYFLSIARVVGLSPAFFHRRGGDFESLLHKANNVTFVEHMEDSDSRLALDSFMSCLTTFASLFLFQDMHPLFS